MIGRRMKFSRERKELTQIEAAKMLNVSNQALSRYETEAAYPDPDVIAACARLYDVSTDYLLGVTDAPQVKPGTISSDGLTNSEREVLRLYQEADPPTREAMLHFLRLYEAAQLRQDDASKEK